MMSEDEIQAATAKIVDMRHMSTTPVERQPNAEVMKGAAKFDKRVINDATLAEFEYLANGREVYDEKSV